MTQPYNGAQMLVCPVETADFQHTCAVVVSGDGINACGHTLLHIGGHWSWYVHIAGFYKVPKFMNGDGYKRYLKENGKREIRRWPVKLPNPQGAHDKLHELIEKPWLWGIIANNCASFVEEVVQAGGNKAGVYLNCPVAEPFA
ncbi:hypothetical protein [Pseudoduganella lutea]|uniref:LRAT domain-containing protein n=1 Tax=Pseudoduganella lutea TaxID=321985 RepID=A0A4P6KUH1_9BURK|nr:hypothetical protein [Pseudoduganella lutea]QBE62364.1 hypothetical protein EWM63_04675 [Pseudoduganella lutea]